MRPMLRSSHRRTASGVAALTASLLIAASWAPTVEAAPKKKYHLALAALTAKPEVKPEPAKAATPRVEAQLKSTFETHPQLVASLDGAPDWKTEAAAFRKYLAKKGVASAYHVTVDITDASIEIQPMPDKPRTQRLVVRVAVHMLGEKMPDRTIGFTGDGQATIKVEVGMKINDRDRQYAWDEASKAAIDDAMKSVFQQLALPPKKQ
jgi:hypothetical protein